MRDSDKKQKDKISEKIRKYCAWRERCTKETEDKLRSLGASPEKIAAITEELKKEGFIDDIRYSVIFARSKFSNNKWGKVRIRAELSWRNIPDDIINKALTEIDDQNYRSELKKLIDNKQIELINRSKDRVAERTAAYCIQKGYEAALVWKMIKSKAE